MKNKKNFIFAIIFVFVLMTLSGCSTDQSSAKWAYSFVVWDGYIYKVSDEYVNEVNGEIGEVTKHSDIEDTYKGNFSNEYEKGTKYYSIKGISTEEAIAIKEKDGQFRKAVRDGKYGEK
ncbi:hypothetical protein [Neobacillus jeddahensis]|uniref:hypothetical protein n=1 Tax=Neobacillus jeddahensis TaxID=1461580 RepID=UPI001FCBE499|nr:hypothetical protein [Neobacillus jeddahensis]